MRIEDFYTTTHDGLKLHGRLYEAPNVKPDAPALICLHGLTRNERDFNALAQWLTSMNLGGSSPRVLCLSFRGRGQSEYDSNFMNYQPPVYVQDVATMLEQQDISEASFIGTSLGGLVTMMLASLEPTKVKAAIFNDVGPELDPAGLMRIGAYVGNCDPVPNWDAAIEKIKEINGVAFPDEDDAFWLEFARNTFREIDGSIRLDYDPDIATVFAQGAPMQDLWPLYNSILCPVLSIRGAISDLMSRETQEKMSSLKAPYYSVEIPNVGHAPTLNEATSRTAIEKFLREIYDA